MRKPLGDLDPIELERVRIAGFEPFRMKSKWYTVVFHQLQPLITTIQG
jgi:hypothetical protein